MKKLILVSVLFIFSIALQAQQCKEINLKFFQKYIPACYNYHQTGDMTYQIDLKDGTTIIVEFTDGSYDMKAYQCVGTCDPACMAPVKNGTGGYDCPGCMSPGGSCKLLCGIIICNE